MFQRFLALGCLLTIALFSVTTAAPAKKNAARGAEGRHVETFIKKMEKELALTPGQVAQVREILLADSLVMPPERFAGRGPQAPGMPLLGDEFLGQLRANAVDTAALNREFALRQAAMQSRHNRNVFKFVQLHSVLTPAQRLKLADLLEKRHAQAAKKRPRK
jgi:Spy/CpxP family protein refolding chaperone